MRSCFFTKSLPSVAELKFIKSFALIAVALTPEFVANHFDDIQIMEAVLKARGDKAALKGDGSDKIRLSNLRAEFTTFNTGGSLITTSDDADPNGTDYPNQLGFDHMQSYFIGVEGNPTSNMSASVNFNILLHDLDL